MLSTMREHRKNRILQVIVYSMFAIIIIVFAISFGPGSWGQGGMSSATHAAKVDGNIITGIEFERTYGDYLENYRRQTGESLSTEQIQAMNLRRMILDSMIDRLLVVEHASRIGVQVPDSEVSKAIRDIDAFYTDGRFDQELFERYVRNVMGSSTGRFFERVREDMLYQRTMNAVRSGASVTSTEIWNRFVEDNDKVDLEYVRLSPVQFRELVKPTPEQIEDILENRADEIAAYYDRNLFRYERPERAHARHILIAVSPEENEEKRNAALAKANEVLEKAQAGEDFAALAEEYSDDPGSKTRGGDLDWFPRGQMVPAFDEAVFNMDPGEISDIVESPFGYHVILLKDRKEATKKELDDVRMEIAEDILKGENAKDLAREKAEILLAAAETASSLGEALDSVTGEDIPEPMNIEEIIGDEEFSAGPDAAALAKKKPDLHVATTGLSPMKEGNIRGIGRNHELAAKIKTLTEDSPLVPEIFEVGGSFYIVRLLERQKPDPEIFASQKENIRKELLRTRQGHIEEAFMQHLRDEARINVNEAMVSR